jgi:hypothetical protein
VPASVEVIAIFGERGGVLGRAGEAADEQIVAGILKKLRQ